MLDFIIRQLFLQGLKRYWYLFKSYMIHGASQEIMNQSDKMATYTICAACEEWISVALSVKFFHSQFYVTKPCHSRKGNDPIQYKSGPSSDHICACRCPRKCKEETVFGIWSETRWWLHTFLGDVLFIYIKFVPKEQVLYIIMRDTYIFCFDHLCLNSWITKVPCTYISHTWNHVFHVSLANSKLVVINITYQNVSE